MVGTNLSSPGLVPAMDTQNRGAMAEHELIPAERIRHPGGKDGWYVAKCTCGKVSHVYFYSQHAERTIRDHIKSKTEREDG